MLNRVFFTIFFILFTCHSEKGLTQFLPESLNIRLKNGSIISQEGDIVTLFQQKETFIISTSCFEYSKGSTEPKKLLKYFVRNLNKIENRELVEQPVGRQTDFGNPFPMDLRNDKAIERTKVCDLFQEYLDCPSMTGSLKKDGGSEKEYRSEIISHRLGDLQGRILGGFCYPKRCHGFALFIKVNSLPLFLSLDKDQEEEEGSNDN